MKIKIKKVEIIDEQDEYVAIFFGDEQGSKYVQIQDAYSYDEQDVKLGMDTYYIERDDQSFSSYGGIEAIEVSNSKLEIHLSARAAKKLEVETISISFAEINYPKVVAALADLIRKHGIKENA